MSLKCDICGKKVEETFLKKVLGTYVKDQKGKKHLICPECQNKFPKKEEILKKI
jgi:endogenous inhibitor of DNA gyrase (YacG/DUF329 family)